MKSDDDPLDQNLFKDDEEKLKKRVNNFFDKNNNTIHNLLNEINGYIVIKTKENNNPEKVTAAKALFKLVSTNTGKGDIVKHAKAFQDGRLGELYWKAIDKKIIKNITKVLRSEIISGTLLL